MRIIDPIVVDHSGGGAGPTSNVFDHAESGDPARLLDMCSARRVAEAAAACGLMAIDAPARLDFPGILKTLREARS